MLLRIAPACLSGLFTLALGQRLAAQGTFPRAGEDPTCKVVDENGKPVAGARAELLLEQDAASRYGLSSAQVLAATPLPSATSDADGDCVLPLTKLHRALAAGDESRFWLVVSKDGHHTWKEMLYAGIDHYLGSRVVLPRAGANDPLRGFSWPPVFEGILDPKAERFAPLRRSRPRGPLVQSLATPVAPAAAGATNLVVRILTDDLRPLEGAVLRFSDEFLRTSRTLGEHSAISDGSGTFAAQGLAAADGNLIVWAEGYEGRSVHLAVPASGKREIAITLTRCSRVEVRTVDAVGRVAPFAPLLFGRRLKAEVALLSDSLGRIAVEPILGTPSTLRCPGYDSITLDGAEARRKFEIEVPSYVTWMVRGAPIQSAHLRVGPAGARRTMLIGYSGADLPRELMIRYPDFGGAGLELASTASVVQRLESSEGKSLRIGDFEIVYSEFRLPEPATRER